MSTKIECLKRASKELKKGIINAARAFKEVFTRPHECDSFVFRSSMQEKFPQFDWFAKPEIKPTDYSVDTAPYPLQVKFIAPPQKESAYAGTYTSFSGCDIVSVFNGNVIGELQGINIDVCGNMEGNIGIVFTQFDRTYIFSDTLAVILYQNEYEKAAYAVLHLNDMKQYKIAYTVDNIQSTCYQLYHGKVLCPISPLPHYVHYMPEESFKVMVERVRKNCTHPEWVPAAKELKPHVANKTYFWVLDTMFSKEDK